MSTILKALKQLEDEKREEPELTLSQQIAMTPPAESTGSRSSWVLVACAAAGIAVAGVAVFFWLDPGSAPDAQSQAVAATPPGASPVTPKPTPSGAKQLDRSRSKVSATGSGSSTVSRRTQTPAQAAPPPKAPTDSRVQVVQRLSPTPKPALKPEPKTSTELPTSADLKKEFTRRERRSVPSHLAEKTRDIAALGSAVPTRPAGSAPEPAIQSEVQNSERATATKRGTPPKGSPPPERSHSRGTVSERAAVAAATASEAVAVEQKAPPQIAHAEPVKAAPPPPVVSKPATRSTVEPDHQVVLRARLPELKVRSTIWHPQGSRRVAMVEVDAEGVMELNEGDVIGPLVVESIKPGGVVFSHDGVSVLHKVGR